MEDLTKYVETLQSVWIYNLLKGTKHLCFSPEYRIADGRSRKRITQELLQADYISIGKTDDEAEAYLVTSKAYDELQAAQPNLVGTLDKETSEYNLKCCRGVLWSQLSNAEQKYIIEHVADVGYKLISYNPNWPGAKIESLAIGDCDLNKSVYVYDPAYNAERDRRLFEYAVKDNIGRNLSWGLVDQKFIEPVDKDCFRQSGDSPEFLYADIMRFSADPAKWQEELLKQVQECREGIANMTRRANILITTNAKIHQFGGWGAFAKKFEERIREELKKEK